MTAMKTLFVDDEPALLNGIRRRLGRHYNMSTAISGPEALQLMQSEGPFAVVVTDMRMPEMNGVQFIQEARKIAPDTIYVMLTGNQDQETAIAALNDGQVFRFLNKPCDNQLVRLALDSALRQYELVTVEKELLHKTFCGAVSVLTDVIELVQPEVFGQAPAIQQLMEKLRTAVDAQDRWEYKLAARLGLLGFALMPESDWREFETGAPADPRTQEILARAAQTSGRLLERIPRLGLLTGIIREESDVDGSCRFPQSDKEEDLINVGATLLRVAIQWNCQLRIGVSNKVALSELRELFPNLHPAFAEVIEGHEHESGDLDTIAVDLSDVREGMVLAEDVLTAEDVRLLRKGMRLSPTMIEHLTVHYAKKLASNHVMAVASSCGNLVPVGV